jgi:hypothetical protein
VIEWRGENWRTAREVAALLGVKPDTVYWLYRVGRLPGRKAGRAADGSGGRLLFSDADLDCYFGGPPPARARPHGGAAGPGAGAGGGAGRKDPGGRAVIVAELRARIADLAVVKAMAEAYGTPDFASRAGMGSILAHEQELQAELRAAGVPESGSTAERAGRLPGGKR